MHAPNLNDPEKILIPMGKIKYALTHKADTHHKSRSSMFLRTRLVHTLKVTHTNGKIPVRPYAQGWRIPHARMLIPYLCIPKKISIQTHVTTYYFETILI